MSSPTSYHSVVVQDRSRGAAVTLFYRAAGPEDAPALVLLHGFPSSSHQFRDLIPRLARKYRVIAPDLPGFGFSDAPAASEFAYTFDHLAEVVESFTDAIGLDRYALYMFDYGAPVGFRLALSRPERVTALISQNGNAYLEGLSDGWSPIRAYWEDPSPANREALRTLLAADFTRLQYTHGESDTSRIAPESYALDQHFLDRPGNAEIQLDLFRDYRSNVALYPRFQAYLRQHRPPMLAVWGRNDPFFLPAGAEAFRRDLPDAEIHLIDAGHFPLETHLDEVATVIGAFLARTLDVRGPALFRGLGAEEDSVQAAPALAKIGEAFGFVPNLARAIAVEPAALEGYLAMLHALAATSLDPIAQQVAMAAASRANGAEYGVAVHATLAAKAGAPATVVTALRAGAPLPDLKLDAVRRFATAVASNRTQVSDGDVQALTSAGFDRRAAVAIALAAGAKTLANAVAHLAHPAIDVGFREPDLVPAAA